MGAYSPSSLTQLYPILERAFPASAGRRDGIRSGILADKPGYHNSRARNARSNYSVTEDRDKHGNADSAAAIDVSLNTADLNTVCRRLMVASLARDPRLVKYMREWFGSYTGRAVIGYSIFRRRPASSDPSHDWHLHMSLWRDTVGNTSAMLAVCEVLLGLPDGQLTGSHQAPADPSSTTPRPPTPVVSLKALVAAAKADPGRPQGGTTAGSEDDVRLVEAALVAAGLLDAEWAQDGAFGSSTVAAYAGEQRRQGYRGDDADGIPGKGSLTVLGERYGFRVAP